MLSTLLRFSLLLCTLLSLTACLAAQPPKDPWEGMRQADGTVTWMEEINFTPPPKPWHILDISEDDFSLAFFKSCTGDDPGTFPCEATIAYAGEPFGYSQDLRQRQKEFFKRFLWASRLKFSEPELVETKFAGLPALLVNIQGTEPARGHRVRSRLIFVKRGERVEAFFMNQWRSKDNDFNPSEFEVFDAFASTFKYVKPSFYETL